MKLSKADKNLIDRFSKTKTVREVGRVLLAYMTVEEMARFVSTYIVLKNKGLEGEVIGTFIQEELMPLLKTFTLSIGDLLPDFVSDGEFMKMFSKMKLKFLFKKV